MCAPLKFNNDNNNNNNYYYYYYYYYYIIIIIGSGLYLYRLYLFNNG